jgi:enterochelin esterase-like enzyme
MQPEIMSKVASLANECEKEHVNKAWDSYQATEHMSIILPLPTQR